MLPLFSAVSLMDFNPNSAAFAPGIFMLFQMCYENLLGLVFTSAQKLDIAEFFLFFLHYFVTLCSKMTAKRPH